MATHLRPELVLEAVTTAVTQRRSTNLIAPFRSRLSVRVFGRRYDALGLRPSMGWVGDAYDNAMSESFSVRECEPLDRRRFATPAAARLGIFEHLEGWYNSHRRRSALDYQSPANYERSQLPVH